MKLLELTYEVDAGFERRLAFFPLGGTYFTVVSGYEERSFNLAQEFFGVAADAVVLDLGYLDLTLGVNEERATIGHAFFFDVDTETAAQYARGVGQHRVVDLLDAVGSVVPCLVSEVRIGAYRVNFHTELLEFGIVFGQVYEFRGAHEGEVSGIEEEDGPLAGDVGVAYFFERSVMECLNLEFRSLCVDDGVAYDDIF